MSESLGFSPGKKLQLHPKSTLLFVFDSAISLRDFLIRISIGLFLLIFGIGCKNFVAPFLGVGQFSIYLSYFYYQERVAFDKMHDY